MLDEAQDILRLFGQSLNALRENDKNKINKLTFMARDYVHIPGFAQSVVEATVRHVYDVSRVVDVFCWNIFSYVFISTLTLLFCALLSYRLGYAFYIKPYFLHNFYSVALLFRSLRTINCLDYT